VIPASSITQVYANCRPADDQWSNLQSETLNRLVLHETVGPHDRLLFSLLFEAYMPNLHVLILVFHMGNARQIFPYDPPGIRQPTLQTRFPALQTVIVCFHDWVSLPNQDEREAAIAALPAFNKLIETFFFSRSIGFQRRLNRIITASSQYQDVWA
jgi:hypothetical protein